MILFSLSGCKSKEEKAYEEAVKAAEKELAEVKLEDEVTDVMSHKIARDMKEKIESEVQYPGTIKVTVIRETRVTEEAK